MPRLGSKSTNNAAIPAARSRATTRSVTTRSRLLWLTNTDAINPSLSLARCRGRLDVAARQSRQSDQLTRSWKAISEASDTRRRWAGPQSAEAGPHGQPLTGHTNYLDQVTVRPRQMRRRLSPTRPSADITSRVDHRDPGAPEG
jgi:hypothetical protein